MLQNDTVLQNYESKCISSAKCVSRIYPFEPTEHRVLCRDQFSGGVVALSPDLQQYN
jgi:hypothetical protein